jgi:hypothetical protein
MNRIVFLMLMSFLLINFLTALPAQARQFEVSDSPDRVSLLSNDRYGFEVKFQIGKLNLREVKTKAGLFDELSIEGYSHTNRIGEPKLPMLSKIIAVPVGAEVSYELISRAEQVFSAKEAGLRHRLMPAQPSLSKSQDPDKVPFELKESAYSRDAFNSDDMVRIEEIGYMRGVRLFQVYFEPVRYNPVSGDVLVSYDVQIRVSFSNPDFIATEALLAKTASHEYNRLYEQTIFNWNRNARTSLVEYPTRMLILCPPNYTDEMAPFIIWKQQQGIEVILTTVGTGGTVTNTSSAIKTYMQGLWSAATEQNPAPTYLLIVGDHATTGDNIIASSAYSTDPTTGSLATHITDNYYVRLEGTDYIPEMYHGRFSVASSAELTNIINKSITFEKTQMTDLSYLGKVVMIAGVDSYWAPTHANGAINYGTENYFNTAHGITSNTYLYAVSGTSDAAIIANANEGRGYINYTAHGSQTSWADPTFTVTNVNAMTNTGRYGVMVGNCCLTNAFDTSVCFGESIIRKADAAGVAYIGGTNSTYWNEDYWWAVGAKGTATGTAPAYDATRLGVYDAMFHDHNEAFTDWAQTTGDVIYMGNLAVNQGGSSYINYYWEIYSIMGDPSLIPYYGVPTANNASITAQILIGATTYSITGATPYSRIGLTMNGVIYGTGITDASGNLNLTITPFTTAGAATLVITAQNKITRIESIPVIAPSGPYMTVESAVYDDASNDAPDYNESGYLDVTFKNVGVDAATNVTATLTCSTSGITITDNTATITSLGAGASTLMDNAFAFSIANNVVNGTVANFTITMTMSGQETRTHNFTLTLNAPALTFGNIAISDPAPGGNGNTIIDPGETVSVTIALNNNGGAATTSGSVSLTSPTQGITILNSPQAFTPITAGGSANLTYSLSAGAGMAEGTIASLVFNATASAYIANATRTAEVGAPYEITIGNGITSETYPLDRYYNYSAHEAIYLATELNVSGSIKSLAFQKASGSDTNEILDVNIYMKHTSDTSLVTGTYSTTGYTLVYSGPFPNNATSGWMQVNLSTLFDYNGTSNLAILTVKGNQAYIGSGYPYWNYSTTSGNRARKAHSDSAAPTSLTASNYLPNLKLGLYNADPLTQPTITWAPAQITQNLNPEQTASQNLVIGNTGDFTLNYSVSKPTGSGTVLDESFENAGAIPAGWTQEFVNGSTAWIFATGGYSSHPAAAYEGSYNARLYYNSSAGNTTKLVTPALNLSGVDSATLTFYHTQALWSPDQDELKVYYKTSAGGDWVQLMHYTANITAWSQETISLPNLTGTYYLAFEGIAKYGYGVCLDKVVVTTTSNISLPWLTVAGGDSYSSSIAGGAASQNVSIGFNTAGLALGTYTSTLTLNSNSINNSSVAIPVTLNVTAVTGPRIEVNPLSVSFGNIIVGSSAQQQFTIQNTGSTTLNGTITTPYGYNVSAVSKESGSRTDLASKAISQRATLSFSISSGVTKTFNLIFAPTSASAYNGNVVITSNDTSHPSVNLAVTGTGYIPLTLNLPASFNFDKNGSLQVDFASYITDSSGNPMVLTPVGNDHVNVSVNNLMVTFSAEQNWVGTETVTFNLSNGITQVSDAVDIVVNQTARPTWAPVSYPNNSATVYGIVTIDNIACQLNDVVGAFVGTECRGVGDVVMEGGVAYVTLLVSLASEDETVSFRIYDHSANTDYPVLETASLTFGEVLGYPSAYPINAVTQISLDAPIADCGMVEGNYVVTWQSVPFAEEYHVYRSLEPYANFTRVGITSSTQYVESVPDNQAFFYIRAVINAAARSEGGAR